jgi:gliding motility-associated-like protein
MRKFLSILSILCVCEFANAQFSVLSPNKYLIINNLSDIDAVFLFNGIAGAEITCTETGNIRWLEYDGTPISTGQPTLSSLEDGKGYICQVEKPDITIKYWIWVIDYSLYPLIFNNLQIVPNQQDLCTTLLLAADLNAPDLFYKDKNGLQKKLTRSFTLNYIDYEFSNEAWQDKEVSMNLDYYFAQISVPAPKKDVTFTLSGDNFAKAMEIEQSITLDYQAIAVESHLKGKIEIRGNEKENQHEIDRDKGAQNPLEGSAPLDINFQSRANKPTATHFEWTVFNEKTPTNYFKFYDENIRYTFNETGEYKVKLKVKNGSGECECNDSVRVIAIDSYLTVPNVFSPNGDGKNDEFRVSYSSLQSYKCVIVNRWGSVIFKSTNPETGWDGKIYGKPAAEGTYYYIINATGTDIETKEGKNKGKPKKYSLNGAINLFR